MIRYDLKCSNGHAFDAWFRDSAGFDALQAAGEVFCAICGDGDVAKALMAPAVSRAGQDAASPADVPAPALSAPADHPLQQALSALRRKLEQEATYVGSRFAAEARRLHAGEETSGPIWGEATPAEARDLLADDIPVAPLPLLPRRND
jgi:hypothetical protein